jgi:beta-glucosidase-like glycosyl hydrolase
METELNARLKSDGTMEEYKATNVVDTNEEILENTVNDIESINKNIMLFDVASGVNTLDEFISQLTNEELINLSQAQPSAFPRGTAGVGNIKKYGIPNPQTADGPAGLRKTVPTTAFPCATLIGCTWDEDLQYEMGKSVGYEGVMTGVDIWLAPGLNIHRDPLCGRNFEYFSEDPLISGRSAASIIRGAQSMGIISTCKHFALNNKEYNRLFSDSIVSERALREVYLKGFEIVVRESQPDCIMSSYNLINGIRASTNYNLLVGILRDEWDFKGAVMTDWRNVSHLWEEIKAGNNIKMPFGYPDEIELAIEMVKCGKLTREELEKSVKNVLKLIMKTSRFKNQDFGVEHTILKENTTRIKAIEITGTSYTFTGSEPCEVHPKC